MWECYVITLDFIPRGVNMPKVIEVVYTAGVLKPLEKIDLQEGETKVISLYLFLPLW